MFTFTFKDKSFIFFCNVKKPQGKIESSTELNQRNCVYSRSKQNYMPVQYSSSVELAVKMSLITNLTSMSKFSNFCTSRQYPAVIRNSWILMGLKMRSTD